MFRCLINPSNSLFLDFRLSPCFESCMNSFGYFPGVRLWFADVSEHYQFHLQGLDLKYEVLYIQPLKMELIEGSEMSAYNNQTPGKYPKEYIQNSLFVLILQIPLASLVAPNIFLNIFLSNTDSDFYKIIFTIKQIIYSLRVTLHPSPPHPNEKILVAHLILVIC